MTGATDPWEGVEVAVSQRPGEPDGFRVVFDRAGWRGRVRLAWVDVDGADGPAVIRFARAAGAAAAGPDRAGLERQAVAAVRHLAAALAGD